ncbi:hypothetical protein CULT_1250012 [[Clostridium] ultunense Esp]|nr:hypothetical protein CULT_1250012 [[Clostridium] ultunense Esp]
MSRIERDPTSLILLGYPSKISMQPSFYILLVQIHHIFSVVYHYYKILYNLLYLFPILQMYCILLF